MKNAAPKKKITKTPSPAAIFAPAQELSGITTLDELELFVFHHVITTAGEWPERKYTPPDDSLMSGVWPEAKDTTPQKTRPMSFEEAAEHFRKSNPGLSLFLQRAYVRECRLIPTDPKRLAMVQLERAGREVKRERGLKEGWEDSAHKEHKARIDDAPHAKRGRKVLKAASQSGTERAQISKVKAQAALADLAEYRRTNPSVSITAARNRIAGKHGLTRKTLERHAKKAARKK